MSAKSDKKPCEVCKSCVDCCGRQFTDFQRVVSLNDLGLTLYRYVTHSRSVLRSPNAGESEAKAFDSYDIFILHNTNYEEASTGDCLSALESNRIPCLRCRKIAQRAQKLLQPGEKISGKGIKGICEHCLTLARQEHRQTCFQCQEIVKKFAAAISINSAFRTALGPSVERIHRYKTIVRPDSRINMITEDLTALVKKAIQNAKEVELETEENLPLISTLLQQELHTIATRSEFGTLVPDKHKIFMKPCREEDQKIRSEEYRKTSSKVAQNILPKVEKQIQAEEYIKIISEVSNQILYDQDENIPFEKDKKIRSEEFLKILSAIAKKILPEEDKNIQPEEYVKMTKVAKNILPKEDQKISPQKYIKIFTKLAENIISQEDKNMRPEEYIKILSEVAKNVLPKEEKNIQPAEYIKIITEIAKSILLKVDKKIHPQEYVKIISRVANNIISEEERKIRPDEYVKILSEITKNVLTKEDVKIQPEEYIKIITDVAKGILPEEDKKIQPEEYVKIISKVAENIITKVDKKIQTEEYKNILPEVAKNVLPKKDKKIQPQEFIKIISKVAKNIMSEEDRNIKREDYIKILSEVTITILDKEDVNTPPEKYIKIITDIAKNILPEEEKNIQPHEYINIISNVAKNIISDGDKKIRPEEYKKSLSEVAKHILPEETKKILPGKIVKLLSEVANNILAEEDNNIRTEEYKKILSEVTNSIRFEGDKKVRSKRDTKLQSEEYINIISEVAKNNLPKEVKIVQPEEYIKVLTEAATKNLPKEYKIHPQALVKILSKVAKNIISEEEKNISTEEYAKILCEVAKNILPEEYKKIQPEEYINIISEVAKNILTEENRKASPEEYIKAISEVAKNIQLKENERIRPEEYVKILSEVAKNILSEKHKTIQPEEYVKILSEIAKNFSSKENKNIKSKGDKDTQLVDDKKILSKKDKQISVPELFGKKRTLFDDSQNLNDFFKESKILVIPRIATSFELMTDAKKYEKEKRAMKQFKKGRLRKEIEESTIMKQITTDKADSSKTSPVSSITSLVEKENFRAVKQKTGTKRYREEKVLSAKPEEEHKFEGGKSELKEEDKEIGAKSKLKRKTTEKADSSKKLPVSSIASLGEKEKSRGVIEKTGTKRYGEENDSSAKPEEENKIKEIEESTIKNQITTEKADSSKTSPVSSITSLGEKESFQGVKQKTGSKRYREEKVSSAEPEEEHKFEEEKSELKEEDTDIGAKSKLKRKTTEKTDSPKKSPVSSIALLGEKEKSRGVKQKTSTKRYAEENDSSAKLEEEHKIKEIEESTIKNQITTEKAGSSKTSPVSSITSLGEKEKSRGVKQKTGTKRYEEENDLSAKPDKEHKIKGEKSKLKEEDKDIGAKSKLKRKTTEKADSPKKSPVSSITSVGAKEKSRGVKQKTETKQYEEEKDLSAKQKEEHKFEGEKAKSKEEDKDIKAKSKQQEKRRELDGDLKPTGDLKDEETAEQKTDREYNEKINKTDVINVSNKLLKDQEKGEKYKRSKKDTDIKIKDEGKSLAKPKAADMDNIVNKLNKVLNKQDTNEIKARKMRDKLSKKEKDFRERAENRAAETLRSFELPKIKYKQDIVKGTIVKTASGEEYLNLPFKSIRLKKPSIDNLIVKLVNIRQGKIINKDKEERDKKKLEAMIAKKTQKRKYGESETVSIDLDSDHLLDIDCLLEGEREENREIIVGNEILNPSKAASYSDAKCKESGPYPSIFKTKFEGPPFEEPVQETPEKLSKAKPLMPKPSHVNTCTGIIRYQLSDKNFIDMGWTSIPSQKTFRKVNFYRMRPARPEFDWFKRIRKKGYLFYDTRELLATFDETGHGRWYYKNGKIALDFYDAEELNANQRIVIYSKGETDFGRPRPVTVLGSFDYNGNGIVLDHSGNERLKYNQEEGIILDKKIGPISHWKWHNLNDPPKFQHLWVEEQETRKENEIERLMDENKDNTNIYKKKNKEIGGDGDLVDEVIRKKYIKEMLSAQQKSPKSHEFKPFKIRMKVVKMNDHFSLRVLDQSNIYILFRDGLTNLKLNVGMNLDPFDIIDTEYLEVKSNFDSHLNKFPAMSKSTEDIQSNILLAKKTTARYGR